MLGLAGRAVLLGRLHEIPIIRDGMAHKPVEHRTVLRCRTFCITFDEAPKHSGILGIAGTCEVQQNAEGQISTSRRHITGVNMPCRIGELLFRLLIGIARDIGQILINRLGNHIKEQPFGRLRLGEHELGQALGRTIGEPVFNRQAIATRL